MTMTTCATCTHWLAAANKEWLSLGFARCALGERWTYLPARFTCVKHKLAEGAEKRVAWLEKRGLVTA